MSSTINSQDLLPVELYVFLPRSYGAQHYIHSCSSILKTFSCAVTAVAAAAAAAGYVGYYYHIDSIIIVPHAL
jgi:hypothetical protein